jgi:hypothetical protein
MTPVRRTLLLAILAYVGFDLSSPAVPGAFMFDAAGWVDSVDAVGDRPVGKVLPTTPVRDQLTASAPRTDAKSRLSSSSEVSPPRLPGVVRYRPRAMCAPSRLAEDPV